MYISLQSSTVQNRSVDLICGFFLEEETLTNSGVNMMRDLWEAEIPLFPWTRTML
jgi:hypothetical protein